MQSDEKTPNPDFAPDYPASWDKETLRQKLLVSLKILVDESEISIPVKRLRFQVEQGVTYQDLMQRWDRMDGPSRLDAWKKLLVNSEQVAREMLPTCVECGECCRKGSPTLQLEDLDLLRQGKLPWNQLFTLRRGEPVRSPFEEKLFFLLDERIKIREHTGTQECVFHDGETDKCSIYADRPMQCRAQACWDPSVAKEMAQQPYLTRRDIFAEVELLLDLFVEHDIRCAFDKLSDAFKRLEESKGETVDEVLELLNYEDQFRHFMGEQLKIPEELLDLVFGRSFEDLVSLFGFRVIQEPDSIRCLVPDGPR